MMTPLESHRRDPMLSRDHPVHMQQQQRSDELGRPSALSAFSWSQHSNQRPRVVTYPATPDTHRSTHADISLHVSHQRHIVKTGSGESCSSWDRDLPTLPALWAPCEQGRRVRPMEGSADSCVCAGCGRPQLVSPSSGSDGSASEANSPSPFHTPRGPVHTSTYLTLQSSPFVWERTETTSCRPGTEFFHQHKPSDLYSPTTVVARQLTPEHWMVGAGSGGREQWNPHASRSAIVGSFLEARRVQSRFEYYDF